MPIRWDNESGITWDNAEDRPLWRYAGQRALSGAVEGVNAARYAVPGTTFADVDISRRQTRHGAERMGLPSEEELEPRNATERYAGRAAEFAGFGAPLAPFLGPAGAAADVGLGAVQGLTYEGVKDLTGNEWLAMGASMAPAGAAGLAGVVTRRALQGGRRGAERAQRALEDYEAAGVPPSAAEATESLPAVGVERTASYMPGASYMAYKRTEKAEAALSQEVERIAGRLGGSARTAEDAGEAIASGLKGPRSSYASRSDAIVQERYAELDRSIAEVAPEGLTVDVSRTVDQVRAGVRPPAGAETVMGEGRSLADAEANRLANDLDDLMRATNGRISYKAASKIRTRIGELVDNWVKVGADRETQAYRAAYASLSADINRAIGSLGNQTVTFARRGGKPLERTIARLQTEARRAWAQRQRNIERVVDPLIRRGERAGEDTLYNAVWSGGNVSISRMKRLKDVLPQSAWNTVVAVTLRRMGRARPSAQAMDDAFSFETFLTNWEKFREAGALDVMFKGKRSNTIQSQYFDDMERIARIAARMRRVRNALYNTSRSAPAAANVSAGMALGGAVVTGNAPLIVSVLGSIGSGMGMQALFTSPRFVRWLAKYGEFPADSTARAASRLASVIDEETDDEARAAMLQVLAALKGKPPSVQRQPEEAYP